MNNTPENTQKTENTQNTAPAGTPAPNVWPTFQAEDAPALIDFLVDVVGFTKVAVYADGDQIAHAELAWPEGGGVMLGSHKPDGPWTSTPGSGATYVVTDRVDELFARVKEAGAEILSEPTDQDYGSREFGLRDPEGNRWSFGTYRGAAVS